MKYYLPLKRKKILQYATIWMNLKDIMQSEINQTQKDKYFMIPETKEMLRTDKSIETESGFMVAKIGRAHV